ncbi:tubulin alpha chain-like isoform X2 [Octopus sinensis]|uniref:Tubulin alpha chain-like isoform X2 n=1 Tax=Octopus sinensis TaxID=2607531 RepID=A0A7E6F619_9MOLL|nr:tubulin alpha chain-like isoform X2 [Octopus sinensis]
MTKCINTHTGQAEVQIGDTYWELYCLEHDIQPNGELSFAGSTGVTVSTSKFFLDLGTRKRIPRSILIYLGPTVINEVPVGKFYSNQTISGKMQQMTMPGVDIQYRKWFGDMSQDS